jgi:hypothetical protein
MGGQHQAGHPTRRRRAFIMQTLRPTGLSSPAYRDWLDYVIVEDGRDVGLLERGILEY